jgi:hypothetical protein
MYIFEESTRRYTINRKGRGRKEVIYPRVADISYTRGIRESMGLSYRGPCHGTGLMRCCGSADTLLSWHKHRPDPWATCIYTTSPPVHSSSHDIVCQYYTVPCTSSARTVTAPTVRFRDTTPPPIEAELRRRYGYYIYIKRILKV